MKRIRLAWCLPLSYQIKPTISMKTILNYFTLALIAFVGFSCNNDDELDAGSAKVNFYLVDAPGDFDEVWIEVIALRIKADDNDPNNDLDDDSDESSWVEIPYEEGSRYINLMDLTGENSQFLGTETFPEGEIDQLRLVLGNDNYVVKGGKRSDLKTPSAQQSGLKIKLNEPIEGGRSYDIVIDFDVEKSIVVAGNSGNIILKPVLRAYVKEAASGIMGQVFPKGAQPVAVNATKGDDVYNTSVDENGNFQIQGMDDGLYTLTFTPNSGYIAVVKTGILVEEGKMKTMDPITLLPKQ
jgi:hypothetical protein